jgi:DNA end-binding protein Ku
MAARATWKGVLQISLVSIPIKLYPATESSESISFNQLHSTCQSRVGQRRWCITCDREVPTAEIVKGFEFEKGKYVVLLEDELDAVKPESTRVIHLTQFADEAALDSLYVDRTYYLAPDGPRDRYQVISDAMHGKVGIGTLTLYGRECLVAVVARAVLAPTRQPILLLHTLHQAADIRSADAAVVGPPVTADLGAVRVARQIIEAFTEPLNLADFTDQYQADLKRLIDDKVAGHEIIHAPAPQPKPVLSLSDALRLSLEAVSAAKKRPAKVPVITQASRLAKRRREA